MPSKSLYKETVSEKRQVPVGKPTGKKRFAMLPADVLKRTDLSASSKIVFAAMAMQSYSLGRVAISHQAISALCGVSRSQVLENLRLLSAVGLIRKDGGPVMQVQPYELLHPRLSLNAAPDLPGSRPAQSRVIPVACPQCSRIIRRLPKVGICQSCVRENKMERTATRVVRRELAKVAVA